MPKKGTNEYIVEYNDGSVQYVEAEDEDEARNVAWWKSGRRADADNSTVRQTREVS